VECLLVENKDRIATITLNIPDRRNAFNRQLIAELSETVFRIAVDSTVSVIILTGAGKSFSAGADIKKPSPFNTEIIGEHIDNTYKPVLVAMAEMEKPIICAVNGAAVGVGSAFVMNCDLIVMAESAFFLEAFSTIGLIPDGGMTWWLSRAIGYHRAYQLAIEAERISAERCRQLGIANKVVPDAKLMEEAYAWARRLIDKSPIALGATKRALRQSMNLSYNEAISMETVLQMVCKRSADYQEGIASFNEKRKPNFSGR